MITKSWNHAFFWVSDCIVYETYKTIRGYRYRPLREVLYPDSEQLTDKDIEIINEILKETES